MYDTKFQFNFRYINIFFYQILFYRHNRKRSKIDGSTSRPATRLCVLIIVGGGKVGGKINITLRRRHTIFVVKIFASNRHTSYAIFLGSESVSSTLNS